MLIDKNTKYTKFVKCPMSLLTADIPSTAKVVYLMLLNRMSFAISKFQYDNNGVPYVVYSTIEMAKDLGMTDTGIIKNLNSLERSKLIKRSHTRIGSAQRIYLYNPDDIFKTEPEYDDDIFSSIDDDEFSTTTENSYPDDTTKVNPVPEKIYVGGITKVYPTTENNSAEPLKKVAPIYTTYNTINTTSLYTTDNTILTYPEKEREVKKDFWERRDEIMKRIDEHYRQKNQHNEV